MWLKIIQKITQVTRRLFREYLVSFKRKMACWNQNVLLLMDQCAFHGDKGVTLRCVPLCLQPDTTSCMQPLDQGIICGVKWVCSTSFFARSRQECSHRRHKKLEHLGCLVRYFLGMEIHHACSNSGPFCKMWHLPWTFSKHQRYWKVWMGGPAKTHWLPQYFQHVS